MPIFAFIPSRYASTRFPGKSLAMIAGKPMIQHTYSCAARCPDISEVYVVTDDDRIFKCVENFGGKAVMTKENHPSGSDRIAEAIESLKLVDNDIIVNIQGDQPYFNPSVISDMVKPLIDDETIPMSTLKYRIHDREEINNSNIVKVVSDKNDYALYFSRSPVPFYREKNAEHEYFKHLGFYAYRKDFIIEFNRMPGGKLETAEKLEQLRAMENGYRMKVMETPHNSIEVDTIEDLRKVEELIINSEKNYD